MAMTAGGRAQSLYNAIEDSNSDFGVLNSSEQGRLLETLTRVFGDDGAGNGDMIYLQGHVDVIPLAHAGDNLNNPIGQPLMVPALGIIDGNNLPCTGDADTGTTSSPQDIQGKGKIL